MCSSVLDLDLVSQRIGTAPQFCAPQSCGQPKLLACLASDSSPDLVFHYKHASCLLPSCLVLMQTLLVGLVKQHDPLAAS